MIKTCKSVLALVIAIAPRVGASQWDQVLNEEYKLISEPPASAETTGATSSANGDGVMTLLQVTSIDSRNWPADSPRPVFVAWCPEEEITALINRLRVTIENPSAFPYGRNSLRFQIQGAERKFRGALCDDARTIMGVNISGGAFAGAGENPRMEFPMPVKGSLLIFEVSGNESKNPVLLVWKLEMDWRLALKSMANTDCWKVSAAGQRNIGKVKGLESKRGSALIMVTCLAPGGRVFYGVNTASRDFYFKSQSGGSQGSFILRWGHGVSGPKQFQDLSLTSEAMLKNGLYAQAKLIGTCPINANLTPDSPIKFSASSGEREALNTAKKCPLPGAR